MEAREIFGWARRPRRRAKLSGGPASAIASVLDAEPGPILPRGAGMSYGDASLGPHVFETTDGPSFVLSAGGVVAEVDAALTMEALCARALEHGRFPIVLPGTRHATVGGCLAADVHGKNHVAVGGFGAQVESFELWTAEGELRRCAPTENTELFRATIGGMGSTGLVGKVRLRLEPRPAAFWRTSTHVGWDLDGVLAQLDATPPAIHVVGWIDPQAKGPRLGRGFVQRSVPLDDFGDARRRSSFSVPVEPPFALLSPGLVAAANELIHARASWRADREPSTDHYAVVHWPFDRLRDWNRLYGPHGFAQLHFVVPRSETRLLGWAIERAQTSMGGAFLGVLKRLGASGPGLLSFPIEGLSLALDMPDHPGLRRFARDVHRRVAEAGGRVYLAKDALLESQDFFAMYPGARALEEVKARIDPKRRFFGDQAARLGLFSD